MINSNIKKALYSAFLSLLCGACSTEEVVNPEAGEREVSVNVVMPGWEDANDAAQNGLPMSMSRAGNDMLYPVTVLVVPDGSDDVSKRITLSSGASFNVSLPSGTYDVYAVCGLYGDVLPNHLSDTFVIPDGPMGKADFAVGHASLTVDLGSSTPELNISAEHQPSWLTLTLEGVPENVVSVNMYIQGLYESYALDRGWRLTTAGEKRFTRIAMTQASTGYISDVISLPCSNATGVRYVVETKTATGVVTMYTYLSTTPLSAGTHLTQTLAMANMKVVEGVFSIDDWTDADDSGTLDQLFKFSIGDQYFSHPATVVTAYETALYLWPHKPLMMTLDEMRNCTDYKNMEYNLLPNLNTSRWAFPTSTSAPSNFTAMIDQIGWDAFCNQLTASGNTPIERTATNVLAYYNQVAGKFYRYDFQTMGFSEVDNASTDIYQVYPFGIVLLAQ